MKTSQEAGHDTIMGINDSLIVCAGAEKSNLAVQSETRKERRLACPRSYLETPPLILGTH